MEPEIDSDCRQLRNSLIVREGEPLLVEVKITPRRDSVLGAGAYYYIVVMNDLSNTKDLNKKKNSLFATMNHGLRTPLNGIIGLRESLRGGEKDKAQKKHFDIMLNSAQVHAHADLRRPRHCDNEESCSRYGIVSGEVK